MSLKKKKNADELERKYNDAEYFVLSMHPLPPVKQADNFRNLFLKAATLRREFKIGIQSLISVSSLNIK